MPLLCFLSWLRSRLLEFLRNWTLFLRVAEPPEEFERDFDFDFQLFTEAEC